MEPGNRPYVDPKTKPGDAGTEEWADTPVGPGDAISDPTSSDRLVPIDNGVLDGSPADKFTHDPNAIADSKK